MWYICVLCLQWGELQTLQRQNSNKYYKRNVSKLKQVHTLLWSRFSMTVMWLQERSNTLTHLNCNNIYFKHFPGQSKIQKSLTIRYMYTEDSKGMNDGEILTWCRLSISVTCEACRSIAYTLAASVSWHRSSLKI